jgi:hypothetical protein
MNQIKSRIGEITGYLVIAKKRGAILYGKSKFEIELNEIINSPTIQLTEEKELEKES